MCLCACNCVFVFLHMCEKEKKLKNGVERKKIRQPSLKAQEVVIINQSNAASVSKATLGKPPRG